MTDYTAQITAWYEAIQYRAPPAAELASFNAQLQAGILTIPQAITQIESSPYTQDYVDPVIREYQAAFGRVPDQAGVAYWVNQVATSPAALAQLNTIFANSAEFTARYGATATTPASPTLVTALYENVLGRAPDTAGLQYWASQNLDAAQLLQAFAQSAEFITDTNAQIIAYQNLEVLGTEPITGSLFSVPVVGGVTTYTIELGQAAIDYTITGTLGGQTVTGVLTSGSGLAPITGGSNIVINAPYGLNDFQSITLSGTSNVLNANYGPGANFDQSGLNIVGVQTWNIQAAFNGYSAGNSYGNADGSGTVPSSIISFTGDASQGNVISGLTTVNFNDNSGADSLYIGDNSEPVQEPNGANGFAINVSNAVGNGHNGVDVDIAAQAFTGKDTINVSAYIVGGFPEFGGSYVIPAFELGYYNNDADTYNPNWLGFQKDAFAIAAGASSGPSGAIGFQNWVISSAGAASVGSINILALGNEGSQTAQTLTLTNPAGDNSATILFATAISDSTSADWQNLKTIDLSGTTGNVVLTGAETDAQESGSFFSNGGGGLLTSDTSALTTIKGGAGNSFYDLSSLSLAAAAKATIDGGHGTAGNSEVAFSNYVVATATVSSGGNTILLNTGTPVALTHIEVLDDTGGLNGSDAQGGAIDLNDFNLGLLQANYDLLSGPLGNLFSISGGSIIQNASFGLGTDVAPAGYELLQLLNADGSTQNVLGANLSIWGGDADLAVNMIDVADGTIASTNYLTNGVVTDLLHYAGKYSVGGNVITVDTDIWDLYSAPLALTGYDISISQGSPTTTVNTNSTLKLWLSDDGVKVVNRSGVEIGSIFDASDVHINAYTTTDIYLPYESVNANNPQGDAAQQNFVVLGSELPGIATDGVGGFIVSPVNTVPAYNGSFGTVNFYDNTNDTGGSPPGGPDNLVLGYTNFTADLAPVSTPGANPQAFFDPTGTIGYASVEIIALSGTGIFDYGHGSLEIGAAAVTEISALSTSHLIMDLPAVPLGAESFGGAFSATGITVFGSTTGQNLIQGSSYVVDFDTNGHTAPAGSGGLTATTGVLEGPDDGTDVQNNFGVGNDSLTGGTGLGLTNVVGLTGDNYFPEGGVDTVNLAHGAKGFDTVWVAQYDVSSIITSGGVDPHYIFGQAVTDVSNGVETYVDGYGPGVLASGVGANGHAVGATGSNTSLLTINGFIEGNNTNSGDILVFDSQDWATGALNGGITDKGLVNTSGISENLLTPLEGHAYQATTVYVGTSASDNGFILGGFDVILDGLAGYQNANQLVQALSNADGGDIGFIVPIAGHTTEHLLIAYNNTAKGGVTIDDVTITNTNAFGVFATSAPGVQVSAVDMVQIDGGSSNPVATIGSLLHNIDFFHG